MEQKWQELLKRSLEKNDINLWNTYYKKIHLKKKYINFKHINLEGANLKGIYLEGANLTKANLKNSNLENAYLKGANLTKANLECANLKAANLENAILKEAILKNADLFEANLTKAHFEKANLENAYLEGTILKQANLLKANLTKANLLGSFLRSAYLREANLRDSNLEGANLMKANLINTDLDGSYFEKTYFRDAILEEKSKALPSDNEKHTTKSEEHLKLCNFENDILLVNIKNKWNAEEFHRFIEIIDKMYNFIYAIQDFKSNHTKTNKLSSDLLIKLILLNQWPINKNKKLKIKSIEFHSPGNIQFEAAGNMIDRFRYWNIDKTRHEEELKQAKIKTEKDQEKLLQDKIMTDTMKVDNKIKKIQLYKEELSLERDFEELYNKQKISKPDKDKLAAYKKELDDAVQEFKAKYEISTNFK